MTDAHSHDHSSGHSHVHTHGVPHGVDPKMTMHVHDISCCEMHSTNSSEKAIILALIGGAFVLSTWIAQWMGVDRDLAQIPAAIGAIVLWIPLLFAAYREIRKGKPSSSVLVALAIMAALAIGKYVVAGGLAFILFLMDAVLRRTAWGAHRAIEKLVGLTPDIARVVDQSGNERQVNLTDLEVGTVIRVRPGENLPADGRIISGRSTINQASLTGESVPVEAETGGSVYAGTSNLTGLIDVEVTRVGQDTTIGKVVTLINEAEQSKTPKQQIIEMVAGHYVYVVLFVAALVFFLSMSQTGDITGIDTPLEKAITVLVVTCPGALLLSSPTAMVAAFAAAARLGIMIKSTTVFEQAATIDTVVLDKTGTITTGRFAVSRLAPVEGVDGARLLQAAATAEQHSNHPLAAAIMETAAAARVNPRQGGLAEEVHGLGLKVTDEVGELYVGRSKWLIQLQAGIAGQAAATDARIEGMTGVHVMENGQYLGAVGLEDRVRPNAKTAVAKLRDLGVRLVCMFTGDRQPVAKRVGEVVGIDHIEAECHPEEKHSRILELTAAGRRVMMVGDGINDGPSLAAADVGVAMGMGGTDIAANSASIALMNDDLSRLPFLIELSRKTRNVVAQNISLSIIIAIIGLSLAASGEIGFYLAAGYHFLGDIMVIGNSFRLVRFGEEQQPHESGAAAGGITGQALQTSGTASTAAGTPQAVLAG